MYRGASSSSGRSTLCYPHYHRHRLLLYVNTSHVTPLIIVTYPTFIGEGMLTIEVGPASPPGIPASPSRERHWTWQHPRDQSRSLPNLRSAVITWLDDLARCHEMVRSMHTRCTPLGRPVSISTQQHPSAPTRQDRYGPHAHGCCTFHRTCCTTAAFEDRLSRCLDEMNAPSRTRPSRTRTHTDGLATTSQGTTRCF